MTISTLSSPSFIIILLSSIIFPASAIPATLSPRLTLRLIHRGSISHGPTSNSRLDYRQTKATEGSFISDVTPMTLPSAFLANLSIGDPPIPQLLLMDTGSDLTWIQCRPCIKCYPQDLPVFDPSMSSSYYNISCESSSPFAWPRLVRDPQTNTCRYVLKYRDGDGTEGVMAKEMFTFQTVDDGLASVSDVVFGCGHENNGLSSPYSGLLGLGPGSFSMLEKLGSKFSYCFGSLSDPKYAHNFLVLGDGAIIEGDPTPLEVLHDRYYVNVESISLGDKTLQIPRHVFRRTRYGTGTAIDTGASVTFLAREAYEQLTEEVANLLDEKLTREYETRSHRYSELCYKGNVKPDLIGFPVFTFHFTGGAELALDVESLFLDYGPDYFCLAVYLNDQDDLNVISAIAQQNYNVAYDLKAMKVYFQRIACELLLD